MISERRSPAASTPRAARSSRARRRNTTTAASSSSPRVIGRSGSSGCPDMPRMVSDKLTRPAGYPGRMMPPWRIPARSATAAGPVPTSLAHRDRCPLAVAVRLHVERARPAVVQLEQARVAPQAVVGARGGGLALGGDRGQAGRGLQLAVLDD